MPETLLKTHLHPEHHKGKGERRRARLSSEAVDEDAGVLASSESLHDELVGLGEHCVDVLGRRVLQLDDFVYEVFGKGRRYFCCNGQNMSDSFF